MPATSGSLATDRRAILAAAFVRATATGMAGVLIGIHLARRGFDPAAIGSVVTAGLGGAAVAALLVTLYGDRLGRRRSLAATALLGAAGGLGLALASDLGMVVASAAVGMLNGMGRDRGAALIVEQAVLPATVPDAERTRVFAWYNVLQDAGHALGALAAGVPAVLEGALRLGEVEAGRIALGGYAALLLLTLVLYARLSPLIEARPATPDAPRGGAAALHVRSGDLHPASRRILFRISALFTLDSLGGGFLTAALLGYFFFERFAADELTVAALFFCARLANAASHLGPAWLARRIGLVNTMVFTHVPSSLLLVTVAFAPSFPVAAALFLLREGLVEMDVPTRQSYVMAVVRPEERVLASGVTHLVRLAAWAVAPAFAGWMMAGSSLALPLVVGAAMKITYDLLLYVSFRSVRPPEEGAPPPAS